MEMMKIRARTNTVISGEPAQWLLDWKRRCLARSNRDAIIQAFRAFQEKIVEQGLKVARLRRISEAYEWTGDGK